MAKSSPRTLRDLKLAAMDGDVAAARALLRHDGKHDLAAQIRKGKPFPPRVKKMLDACTAGTGTRDQLSHWEFINARGEIENLLDSPRAAIFEE
jgi:hypothetical protein